jgi:hypothetical protein
VSRQYEEEYYRYYGWPSYWQGEGLWGASAFPILGIPSLPPANEPAAATGPQHEPADAHLRSTQAVNGYHLRTADANIGHVCDFMMDAQSWAISQLVIKTGHRLSGKEILIPIKCVDRISYDESTVFATLTPKVLEQPPARVLA